MLVDAAVAGFTADALGDVDAVIEIHEVRQIVDADPVERLVVAEAGPHRLEVRAGVPDLRVAVDAGLGRRNARRRRHLNRRVAIAALDANAADMMLVAELHRLLDELVRARDEIRSLQRQHDPADAKQQENQRNNAGFRPRVCAFGNTCDMRSCGPAIPGEGAHLSRISRCPTYQLYAYEGVNNIVKNFSMPCEKFLKLNSIWLGVERQGAVNSALCA